MRYIGVMLLLTAFVGVCVAGHTLVADAIEALAFAVAGSALLITAELNGIKNRLK